MSLHFIEQPKTALDDLIAEQAMDNHRHATRPDDDLFSARRVTRKWCRRCGGYNGHHPLCDEGE